MKVVKKSDGLVIGVFNPETVESDLLLLGYPLSECQLVKSQSELDREYLIYLEQTDWLVTRHRDQQTLSVVTSMTDDEYQDLLKKRQEARDNVINQNALIEYRSAMK